LDDPTQLTDFNPGIASSGLFWTMALPIDAISVSLGAGSAVMQARNLQMLDFHDFGNSLFGGGVPPTPATISFSVEWSGVGQRAHVVNSDTNSTGEYVRNSAQMEWTANSGDYEYISAAASTSASDFAEIGEERNGVFFPRG
jgi:hypothetical protein